MSGGSSSAKRVKRKTKRERRPSEERWKKRTSRVKRYTATKKRHSKRDIRKRRPRYVLTEKYIPVKYSSSSNYTTALEGSSDYVTAKEFFQKNKNKK